MCVNSSMHKTLQTFSWKYDDLSLKKKYARTNPLKYSFFHRIVDSCNLLPHDTRKAVSVDIFKRGVKKCLLDHTLN